MLFSGKRGNTCVWNKDFNTILDTEYLSTSTIVTPHIVMGLSTDRLSKWKDNCIFLHGFRMTTLNGIKVVEYGGYDIGKMFKTVLKTL